MALMMTRVRVANFDDWKTRFDTDPVVAREKAPGYRILRGVEDPNEVYVQVEFPSNDAALEACARQATAAAEESRLYSSRKDDEQLLPRQPHQP